MSNWTRKKENIENYITQFPDLITNLGAEVLSERSTEDALKIAKFLLAFYSEFAATFDEIPTLQSLFDQQFGPFNELAEAENLTDICFLDPFVYPATESFPFFVDGEALSDQMLESNIEFAKSWIEGTKEAHIETQKNLVERFDRNMPLKLIPCQCVGCSADFRTRVREQVWLEQKKLIDTSIEKLHEIILDRKIDFISDYVFNLRKSIDKTYHLIKGKLRKGSVNKLQIEVTEYYKTQFDTRSQISRVYREKIRAFCNAILIDDGIKPDFVSEQEFERFFEQLHINLWKPESFLKKEFKKTIQSIMILKRKDVSSTILRDYLGQFWIHSRARRIKRKIVYNMGPTNSGKTYHAIEALVQAEKGCYLAPLRLLASELYDTMNAKGAKTTLLTGEEVIEVEDATHYSSTIEMARLNEDFDCCVIDEIQMITDSQRGWAWTRALVNINSPLIYVCGDNSVLELIKQILKLTGDELEIKEYTRMTELNVLAAPIKLTHLQKNDALIVFSRKNALKYKNDLEKLDFKVSVVYGRLSPEVRREQARKFDVGETDIMVSTDAIAMGMNLPVKRIIFSSLVKFIDSKEIPLEPSHIKQIAGRAGRFKRFPVGLVTCLEKVEDGIETIKQALASTLAQSEMGMVGPDLDIYNMVNDALVENGLQQLGLSEFLRLFNTMTFEKPFYCVELKEMIEIAEMVEEIDENAVLSSSELFGFACSPVNLGLIDHVQYFVQIVTQFVSGQSILNQEIQVNSDNIDYLETSIKCVELYQWLARHFDGKNFLFDEQNLLGNKGQAIEKLNEVLSERIHKTCSSCGAKMNPDFKFNICEGCFGSRKFSRRPRYNAGGTGKSGPREESRDEKSNSPYGRKPSYDGSKPGGKPSSGKPNFKKGPGSGSSSANSKFGKLTGQNRSKSVGGKFSPGKSSKNDSSQK